jgi:hypothetical protein
MKNTFFMLHMVGALAGAEKDGPYSWNNRTQYYYQSLKIKMDEVLSSNCRIALNIVQEGMIRLPDSNAGLNVASMPVKKEIINWWKSISKPKQMRVDPNLCNSVYIAKYSIFNGTGCQLRNMMHLGAPRCQNGYLKYICDKSMIPIDEPRRNGFILPESDHKHSELPPQPWLLTARNSFITKCGQISSECGLIHTLSNCKGRGDTVGANRFRENCPISLQNFTSYKFRPKNGTCFGVPKKNGKPNPNSYENHDAVFVVAEHDDTHVYHIHLEIMPRIVYHLDFLLANPDIKILIGCDTKKKEKSTIQGFVHMLTAIRPLFELAGLSMSRLIVHKNVFASDVYFPMEGGCQDPVYNTWQILTMRERFMATLNTINGIRNGGINSEKFSLAGSIDVQYRPVMLLLKRSTYAKHTRNSEDLVRQWNDKFTDKLLNALRNQFPRYEVKLFSDKDVKLMECFKSQIKAFAEADVLIGMHGAGFGNQIYMKPNSAIVEFCPYPNDGRCLLGGGPFSRAAAVMSHNYMIHHSPKKEFKWIPRDRTSEFNIERFVIHISSFLQSLNIA